MLIDLSNCLLISQYDFYISVNSSVCLFAMEKLQVFGPKLSQDFIRKLYVYSCNPNIPAIGVVVL